MSHEALHQQILALPVFDTHTHLETGCRQSTRGLYARNFLDICRYFWFQRELQAVGYRPVPQSEDADGTVSPAHAEALHGALRLIRNTTWTRTVMQAMENLYGIRPDSVDRILELSARMQQTCVDRGWAHQVCDRIGIRRTVMGPGGTPAGTKVGADVDLIADRTVLVPHFDVGSLLKGVDLAQADLTTLIEDLKERIGAQVKAFVAAGYRMVRVGWPFADDQAASIRTEFTTEELRDRKNLMQHLGHHFFALLQEHNLSVQVFFGMRGPTSGAVSDLGLIRTYAQNDTRHVAAMHGIFERYLGINFELFSAVEHSSLDMVQAARIYPNVYPAGMWWFTFRRSVLERSMQYRVEALPATRSTFVASDARCIEWSYIKILLIKQVMSRFFQQQIQDGWLDEDAALYTARCWLHDTAERLYSGEPSSRDRVAAMRQVYGTDKA